MVALKYWRRLSRHEKCLILLFLLTLPLVNPWVRGDGIGYYAYVRSLLIEGDLNFKKDWLAGNMTFVMGRVDSNGHIRPDQYTPTGHLDNHFSVGPSILWAPFLVATHLAVRGFDRLGGHIPADGFSRPYIFTIAFATTFYSFLGLSISFRLARKYFEERWAFLATVGIWFASSLPVYMYFNPSWSHAHSAFAVALWLWYWHRTRRQRTLGQWALLGALSGLMVNMYYANGFLLVVPLLESLVGCWQARRLRENAWGTMRRLFLADLLYAAVVALTLLPTLVTREMIYGSPFKFGYGEKWFWTSPRLGSVLFSSEHGLFSWTPILLLAVLGLFLFGRRDKLLAAYLLAGWIAFYYSIASYSNWHGLSSFGNRFFVSLTPFFVLGLAATFEAYEKLCQGHRAALAGAYGATALLIVWNLSFIFQWGTHLVPARGPISWRAMAYNQFAVVPTQLARTTKSYFVARKQLMGRIEQEDAKQILSETQK